MDSITDMINPWTTEQPDGIVSLGSGVLATTEAQNDLEQAHTIGVQQAEKFMENRLQNKSEAFHAPLKRNGLKTFAPRKKSKSSAAHKVLKADRATFARLVIVAQSRDIDMKTVLSYPLSSVASALASCDGQSIAHTKKSTMMSLLEEKTKSVSSINIKESVHSTVIVDAMAIIQAYPRDKIPATFGELAHSVLLSILAIGKKFSARRIDFVGDQYQLISIKNMERERRGVDGGNKRAIYSATQPTPKQFTAFLSSGANKRSLQSFIVQHWEKVKVAETIEVYAAVDRVCKLLRFTANQPCPVVSVVAELESDHEEADTRMLLHAMHADSTSPGSHVIIQSPDTDVAILSLHFAPRMKESVLWFATGTKDKKRVLSISNMATHLGEKLTDALPGIHAFTGCDSVSSFHGKGKKSGFTLASQDQHIDTFTQLGLDYTIAQDHFNGLEAYVCQLYRAKSHSVNDARYELFCSSTPEERSLPPNRDCLMQHAKRASYQTKIWRSATEAITNCPSPDNHGWDVTAADGLQIRWMDGEPAPAGVLKDSSCSCKKGCGSAMCSCKAGNMKCSDLCRCTDACTNKPAGQDSDEEVADSDSDDEV